MTASPTLPDFDYIRPATLEAASAFLAEHAGEARPFVGGTDIIVRMRDGAWHDRYLVDVKHLPGASTIAYAADSGLTVGAAVTMNRVITHPAVGAVFPVLAQAARTVASYQLRNRATLVGNLCNASPAGDTTGACLVLRASLRIHGVGGWRDVPLDGFFLGPGKTVLTPGDIVVALRVPPPPAGYVARYHKLGRNALGDLAIVGVTALGYPDDEALSGYTFRLALASVAPTPLLAARAARRLSDGPLTPAAIGSAAEVAAAESSPIDDTRAGARYRRLMVGSLVRRAVTEVWDELRSRTANPRR